MGTELQTRLAGLAAPGQLVDWAQPFPDLESCWNACTAPELLLWLAARLSTTDEERRAVVACLAELTRRAERGCRHPDESVERAAGTAEAWTRTGATVEELGAAERAALAAAEWAALVAAEEGERARRMIRSGPLSRPASFGTSRGLGALAGWREANRARRVALAAAGTAHAAAAAAQTEAGAPRPARPLAATASGAAVPAGAAGAPAEPAGTADEPGVSWEECVCASAGYAVSAIAGRNGAGPHSRSARQAARLIRRRIPCPRLADPLS